MRLVVEAFKGLGEHEFEFSPGFVVVRGLNEAGKSTLQKALLTALFADAGSSRQEYGLLHAWDAGRKCRVGLTFEVGGCEYELVRDFASGESALRPMGDGATVSGRDPVRKALGDLSGLRSEKLYVATACVRQQELAGLQAGAELQDMLQKTMTGGEDDANVAAALSKLDGEISDTFTKGLRGGERGRWLAANERLDECERMRVDVGAQVSRTLQARTVLNERGGELQQMKDDLEAGWALLKRVRERREKQDDLDGLEASCAGLQKRLDEASRLQQSIRGQSDELSSLAVADTDALARMLKLEDRIEEGNRVIEDRMRRISALDDEMVALKEKHADAKGRLSKRAPATVGLISGLIVVALSIWQGAVGNTMGWVVAAFAALGGGVCARILLRVCSVDTGRIEAELSSVEGQRSLLAEEADRQRKRSADARAGGGRATGDGCGRLGGRVRAVGRSAWRVGRCDRDGRQSPWWPAGGYARRAASGEPERSEPGQNGPTGSTGCTGDACRSDGAGGDAGTGGAYRAAGAGCS